MQKKSYICSKSIPISWQQIGFNNLKGMLQETLCSGHMMKEEEDGLEEEEGVGLWQLRAAHHQRTKDQ
jgi:hypothetical protein